MDADGGIEAEAAAGLPGEHVGDGVLVEEAAALEQPKHAALQRTLQREDIAAERCVASWKVTLPSSPPEKTPSRTTTWKWKWGLRAEPKRWRKETAPSCASAGASGLEWRSVVRMPREQDAKHVAGQARVTGQEGADPLRQGEHPLADGQRGQDVVGQVGRHLYHAAGAAGGADAAALAGERDQPLGGARVAAQEGTLSEKSTAFSSEERDDEEGTLSEKSTAFSSEERDDESGKTDTLFNRGSDDGENHGHVVTSDDGETTNYARDEDGAVYVDDSKEE